MSWILYFSFIWIFVWDLNLDWIWIMQLKFKKQDKPNSSLNYCRKLSFILELRKRPFSSSNFRIWSNLVLGLTWTIMVARLVILHSAMSYKCSFVPLVISFQDPKPSFSHSTAHVVFSHALVVLLQECKREGFGSRKERIKGKNENLQPLVV